MATFFEDYKIPVGLFQKTTKFLLNHISARKWFREILNWLNVPFYDCSCPADSVAGQPVAIQEGALVTFNGTDWVDASATVTPATTGYTGEIVAVEGTYTFADGILTGFVAAP
jgi:hypothetical protein